MMAPPATLPDTDPDAGADVRKAVFRTALGEARTKGRLLHGAATLTIEPV
ncbi:hypothetical protein [Kitasatospora sp. MBT63]|nr:hypothetical protein [Kitasatospora sp. MBT63]